LIPDAAHEALAEGGAADADVTRGSVHRSGERDPRGWIDLQLGCTSFRHDCVSVEKRRRVTVAPHGERTLQRRREPKSDLDRIRVEERGKPARRVPAVRRRQWSPETAWKGDFHVVSSTWGQTPRV
jgi:hypothetical protein